MFPSTIWVVHLLLTLHLFENGERTCFNEKSVEFDRSVPIGSVFVMPSGRVVRPSERPYVLWHLFEQAR